MLLGIVIELGSQSGVDESSNSMAQIHSVEPSYIYAVIVAKQMVCLENKECCESAVKCGITKIPA